EKRTGRDVKATRFLVSIFPVTKVRLVNKLSQAAEPTVTQSRTLHQRLESAVLAMMGELHSRRVEGHGVWWKVRRQRKDERGVGVDKPLDEPCRRDAVNVRSRTRDPTPAS